MWYHISPINLGKELILYPRIPMSKAWGEDKKTPRVCFAASIEDCFMSAVGNDNLHISILNMFGYFFGKKPNKIYHVYVYIAHGRCKMFKPTRRHFGKDDYPRGEVWSLKPIKVTLFGEISIKSCSVGKIIMKSNK